MQVTQVLFNRQLQVNKSKSVNRSHYALSKPLGRDSVSFGAERVSVDYNLQKLTDIIDINDKAVKEFESAMQKKIQKQKELIMLRNKIQQDPSDVGILRAFGANVKENSDGLLSISGFGKSPVGLCFKDLCIDGNKVFSRVKIVEDDLNLYGTQVSRLDNLEAVKGRFSASGTLEKADKLRFLGEGSFNYSEISDLPALEDVKTKIVLNPEQSKKLKSKIETLPSKPEIEVF